MSDTKPRRIEVELNDLIDVINAADTYGYTHPVLMDSLAAWLVELTDEEIEAYAQGFLTPDMREQGYNEDTYEEAKERLVRFRNRYMDSKV